MPVQMQSAQDPQKAALMVTRTFKVNEIHCASCENTIRTALSHLPAWPWCCPAERNDVKGELRRQQVAEEQLRTRCTRLASSRCREWDAHR